MRKPLLCNFRPSFWHQKSINKLCFFKPPFWRSLSSFYFIFCQTIQALGTPSKSSGRQNATPNRPMAPKFLQNIVRRLPFPCPEFSMHLLLPFGTLFVFFWYPFGSNWFPLARFSMLLRHQILPVPC